MTRAWGEGEMAFVEFDRSRPSQLGAVQILRGVAAILVVFSHVLRIVHEQWASTTVMYGPALVFGDFGVDAFFVISGFIMYYTAGQQFGSAGRAYNFWIKRLIRIAPMYWLFTVVALVTPFSFGWHPTTLLGRELSFAFLPDVTNPLLVPVLPVGWTLSFEMLFYLLFGACLALPRRVGLPLLLLAFPALMVVQRLLDHTALGAKPWWPVVQWWMQIRLLLFVFGVVLGMVRERFGRVVDRRGLGMWTALGLLLLGPFLVLLLHAPGQERQECAIAGLAAAFCVLTTGGSWSRAEPLVQLGDASYVLYLSHAAVVGGLSLLWLGWLGPHAPVAFGLAAIAAAWVVASPLHKWLEKPVTKRLRILLEPAPQAALAMAKKAEAPAG